MSSFLLNIDKDIDPHAFQKSISEFKLSERAKEDVVLFAQASGVENRLKRLISLEDRGFFESTDSLNRLAIDWNHIVSE